MEEHEAHVNFVIGHAFELPKGDFICLDRQDPIISRGYDEYITER